MRSFENAISIGVDMLEFDIRRTKDKVFVAYHDKYLNHKLIGEYSYTELEHFSKTKGMHIPKVDEILELVKSRIKIDLELKEEGYETEVVEFLINHLHEEEFIITSFNDQTLKSIKSNFPGVKIGLLLGKPRPERLLATRISELFPMERCRRTGADFLVPHFKLLRFGFLNRAERNNKSIYVWTVNDEKMMARLLSERRVKGIITDRPNLAVRVRQSMSSNW